MSDNRWFRMYHEFATDPKVQMLSEADQRRYIMLLCLRCCNGDVTLHNETVTFQLRISNEQWAATKAVLLDRGLIDEDNKPTAWAKRQYVSDSSKSRVSKHRAKLKRPCNVSVTPPDTDSESDTEADKVVCESAREPLSITDTEIRHRGFVISLPAIELATIRTGLPRAEIKTRCHAHALQWAAEIDAGKLPRDVVPQKIANFLAASIMGEANRDSRTIHRANAKPVSQRTESNRKAGEILARMMAEAQAEEILQ